MHQTIVHRTDNLCRKGHLCFESIDSVKVNDRDVATREYQCAAAVNQKGATWTLTISDIKKSDNNLADGATVTVTYNAYLNEDAVIGNVDDNKTPFSCSIPTIPMLGVEVSEVRPLPTWFGCSPIKSM